HWLPLFHEQLETFAEFAEPDLISLDHQTLQIATDRFEQIEEHFRVRADALKTSQQSAANLGAPYRPLSPEQLYLRPQDWSATLALFPSQIFSPFETPEASGGAPVLNVGAKQTRQFARERSDPDTNLFEAVIGHLQTLQSSGRTTAIAAATPGARERLHKLMTDNGAQLGLDDIRSCDSWASVQTLPRTAVGLTVLALERGFQTREFALLSEQDILGDRLVRPKRRNRSAADVLTEAASLNVGDLVVHADHGIGRFDGLRTIEVGDAPHDCLQLVYHDDAKLFLPVENIELLTRYGSDATIAQLDRLGSAAWQSRKARLRQRLREMAGELIEVAAKRQVKSASVLEVAEGLYDEFVTRFPYEETDDQAASIDAVLEDLASGRPMDRLVCGDVGFGKTEVALRAAFVAAMNGKQVAVVAPTTLLARQHFKTFKERFAGLPIKLAQASRLVTTKELNQTKAALREGSLDIIVGTHAVLGKTMEFADLGLLIIDEEQHFGVQHKERLKQLRDDIHVLTLTATPIPRTLQLSLSGVRELSLITTPPVDRLAVRTFVTPYDPVVIRDALLRERFRDGQSFYVCPRVSDLEEVAAVLREIVPELKFAVAHGQMAPGQLDDIMNAFYDKEYDILLATTIVESGLDIPSANTIILHRADMFGLAQLYQLRGRVGRSKRRAYAYLTTPHNKKLTDSAQKRLKVLQSLDTLGAGFTLASHDLDIRGAGNLLGEEQSGHIKEVGFELYQSMLEDAINA
ncbi:MAG: transcription-repair coupling factor, partial [Pseudomonadota bacterium]